MFIRRGGTIYFPGVVKAVTKSLPLMAGSAISTSVDETNGIGRFLDPDNANKFNSEDTYLGVGVYPVGTSTTGGAVSDNGIIVLPNFTGTDNSG